MASTHLAREMALKLDNDPSKEAFQTFVIVTV
jgi:hypothetical protein